MLPPTCPSSFPQPPTPLHALQLAYQPLHPICNSFDNHWLQQTPKWCCPSVPKKIRQEYGVYTEIRRILPYIRRINTYIQNSDTARGGWKLPYRIIHKIIRIRFWPTLYKCVCARVRLYLWHLRVRALLCVRV